METTYRKVLVKDRLPIRGGYYYTDRGEIIFIPSNDKNVSYWSSGFSITYWFEEISENKESLIEKLLNEKAENNNTIDLNAYALGLSEMYDTLNS